MAAGAAVASTFDRFTLRISWVSVPKVSARS